MPHFCQANLDRKRKIWPAAWCGLCYVMPQEHWLSKLAPDRKRFAADPLGYGALAWHQWELAQFIATGVGESRPAPDAKDLKNPILWLTQAHALSVAAQAVFAHEPNWDVMPVWVHGACDSQYCGAGLMLVGYSLEVCLKAMLILRCGLDKYTEDEKQYQHHNLERLAEFVPELSPKDKAILRALTHYIEWAGRYPDPGTRRVGKFEEVFALAETFQVAAKDLLELVARVMQHSGNAVIQADGSYGAEA